MQQTFVNPRRIDRARLAANMSHADLAFAIRQQANGRIKPTEKSIRDWIKGRDAGGHTPRDGVVVAIAAVTGHPIEFFYELDPSDDEEDARLLRDLELLPADLRARVVERLQRAGVEA